MHSKFRTYEFCRIILLYISIFLGMSNLYSILMMAGFLYQKNKIEDRLIWLFHRESRLCLSSMMNGKSRSSWKF